MQLLFDECVPRPLRHAFKAHSVRTIQEMGWAGKTNGELLDLVMASGVEVLLTVDQNLRYQQNLASSNIAIIVMVVPSNSLKYLLPLVTRVAAALTDIKPGQLIEVN